MLVVVLAKPAAYLATEYGAIVTGIDINPVMVEKAKTRMAIYQLGRNYPGIYRELPIKGRNI